MNRHKREPGVGQLALCLLLSGMLACSGEQMTTSTVDSGQTSDSVGDIGVPDAATDSVFPRDFTECFETSETNSELDTELLDLYDDTHPLELEIAPAVLWVHLGSEVSFEVVGMEPPPAHTNWTVAGAGTISASGAYQAPTERPEVPEVEVTATVNDVEIKHAFKLAEVLVEVTPEETTVQLLHQQQFEATVTTWPEDSPALEQVVWTLQHVEQNESLIGSVDQNGLYTAPATLPEPPQVTVQAVSEFFSIADESVIFLQDSSVADVLTVSPQPDAIAAGAEVVFSAQLNGVPNPAVTWLVNDIEGGSKALGSITAEGRYQAPRTFASNLGLITVAAVSVDSDQIRGEASFRLVRTEVSPSDLSGNQEGESTPITVKAVYSDGQEEEITDKTTTDWIALNPTVAAFEPPNLVVLGLNTGKDYVKVSDERFIPPPIAFVQVQNLPSYSFDVFPDTVKHVVMGHEEPLGVYLVADRGPSAGERQDIAHSPTLSASVVAGNGFVNPAGEELEEDPTTYSAALDLERSLVVLGAMPGAVTFELTESTTGESRQLTVQLVELDVQVAYHWANTGGPYFSPDVAEFHICYPSEEEPPSFVRFTVWFSTPGGELSTDELGGLLAGRPVLYEVIGGSGRFYSSIEARSPTTYESEVFKTQGGAWWENQTYPRGGRTDNQAIFPILFFDIVFTAYDFVFSETQYVGYTDGPQTIRISPVGLSDLPEVPFPSQEIPLLGKTSILTLTSGDIHTSSEIDGTCDADLCQTGPGTRILSVVTTDDFDPKPKIMEQYDFKLRAIRPDGTDLPDERIAVAYHGNQWLSFQVLFDQIGTYQLWLEAEGLPQSTLAPPISYHVQPPLENDWDSVELEFPSLTELYTAASITLRYHLLNAQGGSTPAGFLGNNDCAAQRPDRPQFQSSHLFINGGASYSQDGGTTVEFLCNSAYPEWGSVRFTLIGGQAETTIYGIEWWPAPNQSFVDVKVELVDLSDPFAGCHASFMPPVLYRQVVDDCESPSPHSLSKHLTIFQATPQVPVLTIRPKMGLINGHLPEDENPRLRVRFVGSMIAGWVDSLGLPDAQEFSLTDSEGTQLDGVAGITVEPNVEGTFDVVFELDAQTVDSMLGECRIQGWFGEFFIDQDFPLARLRVERLGNPGDFPPLPLNASFSDELPAGTMPMHIALEGGLGDHGYLPIQVHSDVDDDSFKLVGFGRRLSTPDKDGRLYSEVTNSVVYVNPVDESNMTYLMGNVTDMKRMFNGQEVDLPDFVPDVTSATPGDVHLEFLDMLDGTAQPLLDTTAYAFVVKRPGLLRAHGLDTPVASSYTELQDQWNWPELKGMPEESCAPLTDLAADDPSRDVFVHVDNTCNGDGSGIADMAVVSLDGAQVPNDGRVHAYEGESPIGQPSSNVQSGDNFDFFGVELDGVCYDPGMGNDDSPNSSQLLAFASQNGYSVPFTPQGMIPGVGGTSGGSVDLETGQFTLVSRTPGVDFPGIDCGFLVQGSPEELDDDDYEDVAVDQPLEPGAQMTSEFHPDPERVFTFGGNRDFKQGILSGFQTRGEQARFLITTLPEGEGGEPLVVASLKSSLLVGEWPFVEQEEQGMRLTARVDASTQVYVTTAQWAIPILVAAATGAAGAYIEGGSILTEAGLNVAVALAFTELEHIIGLGVTNGSVLSRSGGELAGRATKRAIKCLKYAFRAGQGATQTLVRRAVHESQSRLVKVAAGSASLLLDVVGGMLGEWMTQKVTTALLNKNSVGGASTLAFDQLWVGIPREALVESWDHRTRTFVVSDFRIKHLSALDTPSQNSGIEAIPENDESDEYLLQQTGATRPLTVLIHPAVESTAETGTLCGSNGPGGQMTADFRLQVGGPEPSFIPFVRTAIAAVKRNTEEATARVRIDRRGTSVQMYLLDAVISP